jgi:iron complex outermembrane receptor protein
MKAVLGVATACALTWASPAPAQTVSEVIVTARKVAEPILTVPVVETVLPRQTLERLQVQDLKDVAALVPGLVIGDSVLASGAQVSIRGVGTQTEDAGNDQSVVLDVDGLQLSQGLSFSSAVFDMAQVEVLKGPQPLFYGKSATAGVIVVRTADPTDQPELIARAGHEFEADQWLGEFIISGPVSDALKLRLASRYASDQGYFINAATGLSAFGARDPVSRTLPVSEDYQIRGTAIWTPVPQFDARLKANAAHDRTLYAGALQYVLCPGGAGALPGLPPFLGGGEDCRLDRTLRIVDYDPAAFPGIENNGTPFAETTESYGTLELNWRPAQGLTVTSTTAYYNLHFDGQVNTLNTTSAAPDIAVVAHFKLRKLTQELRANSDLAGPANFTIGAFYAGAEAGFLPTLLGNTTLGLPPVYAQGAHDLPLRTYSLYGQLRWKIVPKVELALGARWDDEKRSDNAFTFIDGTPVPVPLAVSSIASSKVSPEATLTWRPSDDLTAYAALKRGYKSGSFDITAPPSPGDDTSFADETVEGGEAGLKARLLDRRLALNLAGYDYRYRNLQVEVITTDNSQHLPLGKTLNAGSALVYGVDFDAVYRPVEGLDLHAAANWNHARFKTFDSAPCFVGQTIGQGCNEAFVPQVGVFTAQNLAGTPLLRAPDWEITFGFDWQASIGNGLVLVLSNNTRYSSKYLTDLVFPYYQDAFIKTDVSLALEGPRNRWELALIGKNLGDKLTAASCGSSSPRSGVLLPPVGSDEACAIDPGREVWLRLTLRPWS